MNRSHPFTRLVTVVPVRADLAQHMIYGAWFGAAGAALVLALAAATGRHGLSLLAPVASLLAALAAGVAKEVADAVENRRSGSDPAPHDVSAADVVATLTGAFPVALPLFLSLWR